MVRRGTLTAVETLETAPPRFVPHPVEENEPRLQLFGNFLVREGALSSADLAEALSLLVATNATVGELAVAKGLVTMSEAQEINRLQQHIDGRWGELAITLGFGRLTAATVEELCWEQEATNLRLSDALVELGLMSNTEVEQHLAHFEHEQASCPSALDSLPAGQGASSPAAVVLEALPRLATRILHSPMRISPAHPWPKRPYDVHATATITAAIFGRGHLAVGISLERSVATELAIGFGHPTDRHNPEMHEGFVARFAGLACDIAIRRLQSQGSAPAAGPPVLGELPMRGLGFQLVFGSGRGVLVLDT